MNGTPRCVISSTQGDQGDAYSPCSGHFTIGCSVASLDGAMQLYSNTDGFGTCSIPEGSKTSHLFIVIYHNYYVRHTANFFIIIFCMKDLIFCV